MSTEIRHRRRLWIGSYLSGAASLACMIAIFLTPYPEPRGYAPYMFSYNIGFLLPMMFISTGAGLLSFIFLMIAMLYSRRHDLKVTPIVVVLPLLLVLPMVAQIVLILFKMVVIIFYNRG